MKLMQFWTLKRSSKRAHGCLFEGAGAVRKRKKTFMEYDNITTRLHLKDIKQMDNDICVHIFKNYTVALNWATNTVISNACGAAVMLLGIDPTPVNMPSSHFSGGQPLVIYLFPLHWPVLSALTTVCQGHTVSTNPLHSHHQYSPAFCLSVTHSTAPLDIWSTLSQTDKALSFLFWCLGTTLS